jgi:hypothetical protein
MTEESKKATDLDPFSAILGVLLESSAETVLKFIARAGLNLDWALSNDENVSDKTRKRAFVPRIFTAYNILSVENKLVAAGILARDILTKLSVDKVSFDQRLNQIGWKLDNDHLVPVKPDVLELFFPAGSQHDAYVEIRSTLQQANKSIAIVDPWVDSSLFYMLSTVPTALAEVRILLSHLSADFTVEAKKFLEQHGGRLSLVIRKTAEFHDRFLIIDGTVCYHIGASIKDAGNKAFMISQIQDSKNAQALISQFEQSWQSSAPVFP